MAALTSLARRGTTEVWMSDEPSDAVLHSTKADALLVSLRQAIGVCSAEATVNKMTRSEESTASLEANSA
jgi:hypothetical protein